MITTSFTRVWSCQKEVRIYFAQPWDKVDAAIYSYVATYRVSLTMFTVIAPNVDSVTNNEKITSPAVPMVW